MSLGYSQFLKLRSDIAAQRLLQSWVNLRLVLIKANFHPDQPRAPSGNPDGGQWSDSGGRSWSNSGSGSNVHFVAERIRQYTVDIREEEYLYGGHSIERHIAKTDAELLERMGPNKTWFMPGIVNMQKMVHFFP